LGGHGGGAEASAIVAERIAGAFARARELSADAITRLLEQANADVVARQTALQKMKSTGVALFIRDGGALWAHAGDSRLYHLAGGKIAGQTLDHSVPQMEVCAGNITREQIRGHTDRNRVLRVFGMADGFRPELSPIQHLKAGRHAFLLCTDGFWEYVLESELEAALAKSSDPQAWLDNMLKRRKKRAPRDSDNYSAITVFVTADDKLEVSH
jgi:serine/threonine protein phosphatase PrpC